MELTTDHCRGNERVATTGFGQQETRRKKLIIGVVTGGLALTLLAIGVAYWRGGTRKEKPLPVPASLPTNLHQQLSGYTFTRSDGGRRIFTVHAARTVALKEGGSTVLEDVYVEFFGKEGNRRDVLRTRRCEYNPQSGDLTSSGRVEIELNAQVGVLPGAGQVGRQPVRIETSRVFFRQLGAVVASEAPVKFRIGPAAGSALGMDYATKDGWLELKKDVVVELQPRGGEPLPAPVRLNASRLRYDKEAGQVVLGGPVEIIQRDRQVIAQGGIVALNAQNRVAGVSLEGNVRASDSSPEGSLEGSAQRVQGEFDPATGQLRHLVAEGGVAGGSRRAGTLSHLVAERLEINFAGAHPQPQDGNASGKVELSIESLPMAAGARHPDFSGTGAVPVRPTSGVGNSEAGATRSSAERRTLAANQVQFGFRPDGRSLKNAQTIGPGKLVLASSDPKVGEREITAGQLLMSFDPKSRLENLRGLSGARMVFQPAKQAPPGSLAQETTSERLEASFDPSTESLRAVEQIGNFQFREGERQASAEQARYVNETQVATLVGHPKIWDAATRISAERVKLDMRTDTAEGLGKVQSTHLQAAGQAKGAAPVPTNVVADRMVGQRESQFVHYEGHVRAWHGSDVVESSSLDVYRAERRVSSGSQVVTSHLQSAALVAGTHPAPGRPQRETRPVTIRADHLDYLDQGRKASYRGNVQLQTENTTLKANRMDVFFTKEGTAESSEVDRAVAEGQISVVQPSRRASGEHAEYEAGRGKIVVTGGPPTLYDAEKGFTTGQRLTFFIHDDRLFVDGGDESPTLSKRRVAQ